MNLIHINIDIDKAEEHSLLSHLADSVYYIPLESGSKNLIGQINKIVIHDSCIYILDKSVAKKVFKFDMTGKFVTAFGKTGRGPGEYLQIRDFIINAETNQVEIYDAQRKRMLIYSLDGSFINQESTKFWFTTFEKVGGTYLFNTNKMLNIEKDKEIPYSLLTAKNKNTLLQKYFEYNPAQKIDNVSYELQNVFTVSQDCVYITKLLYDTLYVYRDECLYPLYYFDYGKYQMPEIFRQLPSDALKKELQSSGKYAYAHTLYGDTPQYLYFTFGYQQVLTNQYMAFYSKEKQKTRVFKTIVNDIDNGVFPIPVGEYNGFLISVIQPYVLQEQVQNNPDKKLKNQIKEIYERMGIEDNPILMMTRIDKL